MVADGMSLLPFSPGLPEGPVSYGVGVRQSLRGIGPFLQMHNNRCECDPHSLGDASDFV